MWSLAKLKSWSDASCSHGREDAEKGVNQPEPSFQLHSIVRSSSSHRPSVSSLSPAIHKDRHSTSIRMPSLYENTSTTSLCPLLSSVSGKIGTAQRSVSLSVSKSKTVHPLPPSSSVSSECEGQAPSQNSNGTTQQWHSSSSWTHNFQLHRRGPICIRAAAIHTTTK